MLQKGFTLIELMIVVAIIGILSMMAMPFYQSYIVRVESTRVLSDVFNLIKDYQLDLAAGTRGSSKYSATELLKLAPNTFKTFEFANSCVQEGVDVYRIQWTDRSEIAKILNNYTSKINYLDVNTFKYNNACTADKIVENTEYLQNIVQVSIDYAAYGLSGLEGGAYMAISLGGKNIYYDAQGGIVRETNNDNNAPACGFNLLYKATTQHLPRSFIPSICRYYVSTDDAPANSGASYIRRFYPM